MLEKTCLSISQIIKRKLEEQDAVGYDSHRSTMDLPKATAYYREGAATMTIGNGERC